MSMKKIAALLLTAILILSTIIIPTSAETETAEETSENLALSATATAISEYISASQNYYFTADKINNGINVSSGDERWTSLEWRASTLATTPVWCQLQWDAPITFTTIDIYEWKAGSVYRTDGFTLSVSDNGVDFTPVFSGNQIGQCRSIVLEKPVTAKYLRLTLLSVVEGQTDIPGITEIEVYDYSYPTDGNIAPYATPSAISNYKDNQHDLHCGRLNDGVLNQGYNGTDRWTSLEWRASTLATTPIWCQYKWDYPATFDTVDIYEWKGGGKFRTNEFRISISDDGITFNDIYTGNGIGQYRSITLDKTYTAKYLRVTFYSVLDGITDMPCINEIEVYNYSDDAYIKSFVLDGVEGVINEETATILLSVEKVSDYQNAIPTITVSNGATYNPAGAQDFTSPITYTVTAKDNVTTRNYTVTLMDKTFITDAMLSDNGSSDVAAFGPTPSPYQYNYQRQELAAFLHFSMSTFNGNEWSDGTDPVSTFNLTTPIEADEYVKTMKAAGFKKIIVTAKHHDGFCIWDSKYTEYDIAATNYPGDVLAEVSAACSKYGMEMGLYVSPWDRNAESYGYYDKDHNPTDAANDYLDYNEYYINQLEEILSNPIYGSNGHFTEIWLDGAKGSGADAQEYDFVGFVKEMHKWEGTANGFEDEPLLFGTSYGNVRWIGNELGVANEENWSKANGSYNSSTGLTATSMGPGTEYKGTTCNYGIKDGNYWVVPEVDARINSTWFWHENTKTPKTLEALKEMYLHSVGHNSVLLLNVPLNNKGTLDAAMKNRVLEWGENIQASFHDNNLLTRSGVVISATEVRNNDIKFKPSNVADENDTTYWAAEDGTKNASLYIDLGQTSIFDALTIEEDIRFGQRIEKFTVSYKNAAGVWIDFANGTTIGGKRVILEKPVQAKELRISFTGMTDSKGKVAAPVISHVGVYKATSAFALGSAAPEGIKEFDSADTTAFNQGTFTTVTDTAALQGSVLQGDAGKTLTFTFSGTMAWLLGEKNTTETLLSITIDGNEAQTVTVKGDNTLKTARIFETPTLSTGTHTATVTVVSGTAKIDGLYVLDNGGAGMFDFEQPSYVVNEDMYFDVKVVRKGGSVGAAKVIVLDNPGSAVQSSYHTTSGIVLEFAEGETEKTVTLRTKRYTETTGTLSFSLEIVSATDDLIVTGFNHPCAINIIDAESYSGGYLRSMKVEKNPDKKVYRVGEKLDLIGLKISGTYASGDTRAMQADQYVVDTDIIDRVGAVPVTVTSAFDGKSTRFTILVFANGDANRNGQVNIADLVSIQRGIAVQGDINLNGIVDKFDQATLRQHLIGKIAVSGADTGAMTDVINELEWTVGVISTTGVATPKSSAKEAYCEPISANFIIFENPCGTGWNKSAWVNIHEYDQNGNYVTDSTILISNDTVFVTKPGHTYRVMNRAIPSDYFTSSAELMDKYPCSIVAVDKLDAALYSGYAIINRNGDSDTTWNAVGDSLTSASEYYFSGVVSATGFKGTQYGQAGSTLAVNDYSRNHINSTFGTSHEYTSIVERVLAGDMKQADIWTVYGGTNDWYYGSALGSLKAKGADFDKTTIYGALQAVCEYILAEDNKPRLVLISPSYANRERAPKAEYEPTYEEIRTAFAEVAALYGVEHLDMWTKAGINEDNAAEMLKDGVHPTTAGSAKLVGAILAQLSLITGDKVLDSTDAVVIKGIELDYDDYFTFDDAKTVELISLNEYVTLSGKTIHAEKLTTAPVLLKVDGVLHMVSVVPAKVAVFLVDGQSNARGVAGDLDNTAPITPKKGNGYVYENVLKDMNTYMADKFASITNNNSIGFAPALAAEWYELTGEKVVIIQQGHDGAPIHFWKDKGYTTSTATLVKNAIKTIKNSGNYEITTAGYYWLQGESNMILTPNTNGFQDYEVYTTPEQYATAFMEVHSAYISALETSGVDAFCGILAARSNDCTKNVVSVSEYAGPRAAQQALANANTDIYMASVLTDRWNQNSAEAYTFTATSGKKVSVDNVKYGLFANNPVHYAQNGYNAIGMDAADNMYKALNDAKATDFTLVGHNNTTTYLAGGEINAAENLRRTDTQNSFEKNAAQLVAEPNNLGYSSGATFTLTDSNGRAVNGIIDNYGYIADVTKLSGSYTLTVTVNGVSKSYTLVYKNATTNLITDVEWTFGGVGSGGELQPAGGTTGYRCYSDAVYLNHLVVSSTAWSDKPNWTQIKVYDLQGKFIGEQDITKDTVFVGRSDRIYRVYVANRSSANKGTAEWILAEFGGMSLMDMTATAAAAYSSNTVMESK